MPKRRHNTRQMPQGKQATLEIGGNKRRYTKGALTEEKTARTAHTYIHNTSQRITPKTKHFPVRPPEKYGCSDQRTTHEECLGSRLL